MVGICPNFLLNKNFVNLLPMLSIGTSFSSQLTSITHDTVPDCLIRYATTIY